MMATTCADVYMPSSVLLSLASTDGGAVVCLFASVAVGVYIRPVNWQFWIKERHSNAFEALLRELS